MADAGLDFRATKDLDIVLHVEALTAAFGEAFWAFVEAGGYAVRAVSGTRRPVFYRFQKPTDARFPATLELFARSPEALVAPPAHRCTRIAIDDTVSSLSALLLDDDYYAFVLDGRRRVDGLVWVAEDRLIPLKACAWLDLTRRRAAGEAVDARDVRKHLNDVLRLSRLLSPVARISLPPRIATDLARFLDAVRLDGSINPSALGLGDATVAAACERIARAFEPRADPLHASTSQGRQETDGARARHITPGPSPI